MFKFFGKLLLVVLLTTIFLNFDSQALLAQQSNIQITRLETEILPEYDTADILVLNSIQIQNKSNQDYTGDFRWIVPNGSKTHIVIDSNNNESRLPFNLVQSNGNTELVWKLLNPLKAGETKSIHLEYYFNNFQGNIDKSFSFEITQPYPILTGQIYIFQPTKATNFKLTPEMGPPQTGQQFTYYQKSYSNLSPDQKVNVAAFYTKSDPNPSVSPASGTSSGQSQTQNQNVPSQNGFDRNTGIYIIAGLCIITVLLAAKIISNNRKLTEIGVFELEEDEDEEDEEDAIPYAAGGKTSNIKLKEAKLEKDYMAGRITEEDYIMMLEELKQEEKGA